MKNEEVKKKEKIESNTDKDSGMFFKNEKEKCFAYLAHTACDWTEQQLVVKMVLMRFYFAENV